MSKLREQRIEMLKEMAEKTGGMITTSQIEKAGISRVLIPTFIDEGILVKEARGIYYYADEFHTGEQPKSSLFLWHCPLPLGYVRPYSPRMGCLRATGI